MAHGRICKLWGLAVIGVRHVVAYAAILIVRQVHHRSRREVNEHDKTLDHSVFRHRISGERKCHTSSAWH